MKIKISDYSRTETPVIFEQNVSESAYVMLTLDDGKEIVLVANELGEFAFDVYDPKSEQTTHSIHSTN